MRIDRRQVLHAAAGLGLIAAGRAVARFGADQRAVRDAAQDAATDAAASSASLPVPPPTGPLYAARTRLDRVGRVMVPVMVNGQGPFRFIVDTGASRSALSQSLVSRLGLVLRPGDEIRVKGVTGEAVLPCVRIAALQAGALRLFDSRLPVLAPGVFAEADGILGIEGLDGKRLDIDFGADRVTITRATGERAPTGFLVVPVQRRLGGLLIAEARIGRVRGRAIIDTGAERTLGNLELQRRLLASREPGESRDVAQVTGATDAVQSAELRLAPVIRIGDAVLDNLEVTFGDMHVFRVWNLEQSPALLLGMDLLGMVERLVIDYRRSELHILP